MISEEVQYAGDTQIASTIVVEQTGPMQLTAHAGSFTTAHGVNYVLPADIVLNIIADSLIAKLYITEFGLFNGIPDLLCRSQLAGEALPAEPAGWSSIHYLINAFVVPVGTVALDEIKIPVFTTRPGFPPNEGVTWGRLPDGSIWQKGVA